MGISEPSGRRNRLRRAIVNSMCLISPGSIRSTRSTHAVSDDSGMPSERKINRNNEVGVD